MDVTEGGTLSKPIEDFLIESGPVPTLRGSLTAAYKYCVLHLTLRLMVDCRARGPCRGLGFRCYSGPNVTVFSSDYLFYCIPQMNALLNTTIYCIYQR